MCRLPMSCPCHTIPSFRLIATLGRETCIILPADVEDEHSLLAINVPFLRYTTDQSIRLTAFKVWFWLTRDCQFAISIESHACMWLLTEGTLEASTGHPCEEPFLEWTCHYGFAILPEFPLPKMCVQRWRMQSQGDPDVLGFIVIHVIPHDYTISYQKIKAA